MYIYAVHLENFRSFDELWLFPNPDINILIGPNNCGKSTVLHALALLLDPSVNARQPDAISRFDFHNLNHEEPVELSVWLKPRQGKAPQGDEIPSVFDEKDDVKRAFFDKLSEWRLEVKTGCGGTDKDQDEKPPRKLVPYVNDQPMAHPPLEAEHASLLAVRLRAVWNEDEAAADVDIDIINQMGDEIAPFGIRQRELLGFKLLGARRNPAYELSMARRSILSQMVDEAEINSSLRQLLGELDRSAAKGSLLAQTTVTQLLNALNSLISPNLLGPFAESDGGRFTMTFLSGELWRLRGATSIATKVTAADGERALPLEYQGDGIQNLMLLAQMLSGFRGNQRDSIIALEEPEQNLEPSLARWIFGELCTISHGDTVNELSTLEEERRRGQVIVTTHSPALVSELKGPESLIVFAERSPNESAEAAAESTDQPSPQPAFTTIALRYLPAEYRKRLDQERERFASALFARQVLIVEGPSEAGFLPVAFRHFSKGKPHENPYHLGLEVLCADGKNNVEKVARFLKAYGRRCHVLVDYDGPGDAYNEQDLKSRFHGHVECITCWSHQPLLSFAYGCDLEVILAAHVPCEILFEALQTVYEDAGHDLQKKDWEKACKGIIDPDGHFVASFPDPINGLANIRIGDVGDEVIQRAFLYALLHGPHCCKSTKDMRIIGQVLEKHSAIPPLMDDLRAKIVKSILAPSEIDHAQPYLATRQPLASR